MLMHACITQRAVINGNVIRPHRTFPKSMYGHHVYKHQLTIYINYYACMDNMFTTEMLKVCMRMLYTSE